MSTSYRERLYAPPSWWLVGIIFGGICGWIMVVAGTPALGVVAAIVGTLFAGALIWAYGSLTLRVADEGVHIGRAHLPRANVGPITMLDGPSLREQLGPQADARAWLATRPYVEGGIRIDVDDPADPTPYWLVSSRHPEAVAEALELLVGQTGPERRRDDGE